MFHILFKSIKYAAELYFTKSGKMKQNESRRSMAKARKKVFLKIQCVRKKNRQRYQYVPGWGLNTPIGFVEDDKLYKAVQALHAWHLWASINRIQTTLRKPKKDVDAQREENLEKRVEPLCQAQHDRPCVACFFPICTYHQGHQKKMGKDAATQLL